MLRIARLSVTALVLLVVWGFTLTVAPPSIWTLVALAPIYLVFALGLYLASSLAYGVATFRTVPEESEYLKQDIARARAGLARVGITA